MQGTVLKVDDVGQLPNRPVGVDLIVAGPSHTRPEERLSSAMSSVPGPSPTAPASIG